MAPRNVLVRQVRARTPPLHGSEFKDDIYIDLAFAAQSSLSKRFKSLIFPYSFWRGRGARVIGIKLFPVMVFLYSSGTSAQCYA